MKAGEPVLAFAAWKSILRDPAAGAAARRANDVEFENELDPLDVRSRPVLLKNSFPAGDKKLQAVIGSDERLSELISRCWTSYAVLGP
jgi:hypothetical protein